MRERRDLALVAGYSGITLAASWLNASSGDEQSAAGTYVLLTVAILASAALGLAGRAPMAAKTNVVVVLVIFLISLADSDVTLGWGELWLFNVMIVSGTLAVVAFGAQSVRRRLAR